ncbi:MAG: ROK family protein [Phycisphaeraceae bacterium]
MAKSDNRLFIGVDLGGTNVAVGAVDAKNKVVVRDKKKTKAEEGTKSVIERIVKLVKDVAEQAKVPLDQIGGLGIGAPGAVDMNKGVVLNAVNLRWTNFPLAAALKDELKIPVTVDNDVNVGTWGEHVAGAAKDYDDLLGVFVGTGIGGGLVLGGQLYHGHYFTAGEIGHTVLFGDSPLGMRTLENRASRTAMANTLKQLILSNHESEIFKLTEGNLDAIRSGVLSKALKAEDPLAMTVIRQSAAYVGISIANTLTLLSLPCAVVGGGAMEALGDVYLKWVKQSFEEHVFPQKLRSAKILASKLGDDAGVVGAADLARIRLG